MLIKAIEVGYLQTNCYIVADEATLDAAVIDPGADSNLILDYIERCHFHVRAILLTHGHFDHLLGAHHIKEAYGAKVYIDKADAPALTEEKISLRPADAVTLFEPTPPDGFLTEGEHEFACVRFRVIPSPGHTMGGVCLLAEDDGVLFTGDTLFVNSFGRTDLYGGDWTQLYHSLKRLLALDGSLRVLPATARAARWTRLREGFIDEFHPSDHQRRMAVSGARRGRAPVSGRRADSAGRGRRTDYPHAHGHGRHMG